MITIKDFMETVDYRITEGSDYCWDCYGENAYSLDYWNQDQDGHTVSIIIDTRTHEVYEACAYDYKRGRAYRLINPLYKEAHDSEGNERGVEINQAWDDVNFVELDVDEDFLEKARAIVADEEYDTRVQVPVELADDVLFALMKQAHEQDITLNQHMENVLRDAIDLVKQEHGIKDWNDEETVKKLKKKKKGQM
jgi:hypothetical protein